VPEILNRCCMTTYADLAVIYLAEGHEIGGE